MVVLQESVFISDSNPDANTSERRKLVASMATVGSILGLSKKNPTPLIRVNPYVNTDANGTVLPHPEYDEIIRRTDLLLANVEMNDNIEVIDELATDMDDDFDGVEEDIDYDTGENWSED